MAAAGKSLPIVKLGTDNSVIDAQNKAGDALTGNPNVKHWVVWGCNDESETGVVTALQNGQRGAGEHHRRGARRLPGLQGLEGRGELR